PSLEKVLAGDPALDHPAVREAVLAAFAHSPGLWTEAGGTASTPPTAAGVLKTLVRPWFRPILMEALDTTIQERSRGLAAAPGAFHYNVAILGSGPNGAVAALNIRRANPGLKVALVEERDRPGQVFRNFGRLTWINSPEALTWSRGKGPEPLSTNQFTGLPLLARDLLEPGIVKHEPYFLMPYHVGDLTELTVMASGADCWLGVQAEGVEPSPGQGLAIRTRSGGPRITADRVLVASGLGQAPPPEDPKHPAPPQDTFDDIAARATALVERNLLRKPGARASFMAPYAGKTIAIIGAGDSANNLAELACGFAPAEIYGHEAKDHAQPGPRNGPGIGDPGGPTSVLWVNQRAATGADRHVTVDYLWRATGYEAASSAVVKALYRAAHGADGTPKAVRAWLTSLEAVRGRITVTAQGPHLDKVVETSVGRRMPASGALLDTYFAGALVSPLATPLELREMVLTHNGHSLEANLPRSASLGAILAGLPGYRQASGEASVPAPRPLALDPAPGHAPWSREVRLRLGRPGVLMAGLPSDPARRKAYGEIATTSLIARALRGQRLAGSFTLNVQAQGRKVQVATSHLEATQAEALVEELRDRTEFLALAADLAHRNPNGVAFEVRGGNALRIQVK
ncbi:MAG: FAD-dependent oxidoreductase, partial [Holophaga sp.]|nr:FAD-dependent oxidoreductase [Holophaga sp.]